MLAGGTHRDSEKNIMMSDLPSENSYSENEARGFEVVSAKDLPEILKDVPSDFPILGKKDNNFESHVFTNKSRKQSAHKSKPSINLPDREILES